MLSLVIPREIISLNKMSKWHWGKRSRESKAWEADIFYSLNGKIKKASKKMLVTVTSFRKCLLDKDNLIGGFKGGRDSLKRLGLIVDDSPKWCEFVYEQVKSKQAWTTILLQEIE